MRKQFTDYKERDKWVTSRLIQVTEEMNNALAAAGEPDHLRYAVARDADDKVNGFTFAMIQDEARIYIRYDEYKNRLSIHGSWPQTKLQGTRSNGPVFAPRDCLRGTEVNVYSEITVDADKAPDLIARDIARRFLPNYITMFKRCQETRDQHEAYVNGTNVLAEQIAIALGKKSRAGYGNREGSQKNLVDLNDVIEGVYGDVETSDNTASFKIRALPADKAVKLAKFLSTL